MKLQDQIINRGETLFQYRGQMPLILLLAAIPVIFNSSYYNSIGIELQSSFQWTAIFIACCGLCLRYYTVATSPDGTSGKNRKKQEQEQKMKKVENNVKPKRNKFCYFQI